MIDLISGLFIDLILIGGIIVFGLSFTKKFNDHKSKMLIAGVIMIVIGLLFLDFSALVTAYENGLEASK